MMEDLCIVVATSKKSFHNVYSLLESIDTKIVSKKNVIVVSGQEDYDGCSFIDGYYCKHVTYTGLHLTSFIYIYENLQYYKSIKWWVMIPDTVQIGGSFFEKLQDFYNRHLSGSISTWCVPFINNSLVCRPTMDMGIFSSIHLFNIGDYLHRMKLTLPYANEELEILKKQLICNENLVFGLNPCNPGRATTLCLQMQMPKPSLYMINDRNDIIEELIDNGTRNRIYLSSLDLYKIQRNFRGPDVKLVLDD